MKDGFNEKNYFGTYKGVDYLIKEIYSLDANWFVCYVDISNKMELYKKTSEIIVHGGITFRGKMNIKGNIKTVIGWDYCHSNNINYKNGKLTSTFDNKDINEVKKIILKDIKEMIETYF